MGLPTVAWLAGYKISVNVWHATKNFPYDSHAITTFNMSGMPQVILKLFLVYRPILIDISLAASFLLLSSSKSVDFPCDP